MNILDWEFFGGPSGVSWSPLDLTPKFWLDFEDESSLTITASPDVDSILDQGGVYSFSQALAGKKMHWDATEGAVLSVSSARVYSSSVLASIPTKWECWLVLKVVSFAGVNSGFCFNINGGGATDKGSFAVWESAALQGNQYFDCPDATAAGRLAVTSPKITAGGRNIFRCIEDSDADVKTLEVNGTEVGQNINAHLPPVAVGDFFVNAQTAASGDGQSDSYYYDLIFFDRLLDGTESAELLAFLQSKHGL